ncbi:hypothetical protein AMK59_404 [Oryctes borbonicus]|uniref:Uncharacterized protein n=1 Tax=Oryctes borbonicus TaxID=1629725 RepID=A0A0T6BCW0_9SCAR|nr:hypothetical protein AMK59_404 [Oryctes borbonicus]
MAITAKQRRVILWMASNSCATAKQIRDRIGSHVSKHKFNLDKPDGFQYYFHDLRLAERLLSRRHSGVGSVMVWGAISSRGIVGLEILEDRLLKSAWSCSRNKSLLT